MNPSVGGSSRNQAARLEQPRRRAGLWGAVTLVALLTPTSDAPAGTLLKPFTADLGRKAVECVPLVPGAESPKRGLWERAKTPALADHCRSLTIGYEALGRDDPNRALSEAARAEILTPGLPGPLVLKGHALVVRARPGSATEPPDRRAALTFFEQARALHPRALDDAATLEKMGVALLFEKRFDEARRTFRAVLARASAEGLCPECIARAYVTSAALVASAGVSGLDEALALLREANNHGDATSDGRRYATLLLALQLDRHGDGTEARQLATETVKLRGIPTEIPPELVGRLPEPAELLAVSAFAYESIDVTRALSTWKRYLELSEGKPFALHAKAKIASLEKGGTAPKAAKPKGAK